MRKTLLLASLLILGIPTSSQAIVSLGLRLGAGVPAGDVYKAEPYKDYIKTQFPLQLDVMFGDPSLQLGLYVGYGANRVNKSGLAPGESVDSATTRAGVQVTARLLDLGLFGVWGGLGTGYESMKFDYKSPAGSASFRLNGWEFLTLSAGVDLFPLPLISFGAYASAGFGQFNVASAKLGGVEASGSVGPDKRMHSLYQIGLRGMFNL